MDTIGHRIKIAMKQAGISQTELANELGKSEPNINMWLKDKISPKTSDIPKLCEILSVSPNYLFGYEDKIPKKSMGAKMKEFLKSAHIKQIDAAKMLGVTVGELNHWLLGRRTIKAEDIEKFCEVFHTTPNYLMGYEEEEK